jgi:hypothetical protein
LGYLGNTILYRNILKGIVIVVYHGAVCNFVQNSRQLGVVDADQIVQIGRRSLM